MTVISDTHTHTHTNGNNTMSPFYKDLLTNLQAIIDLPIHQLDQRQPMLVDLLVAAVDFETDEGICTAANGNTGLERMPYWEDLNAGLESLGFTRLGNGHFSAAYKHPALPGKVIKVGFKKEDSGAAYAAFCRMNQGRPGIPTIYDIQRHSSCYTVVMDELMQLASWGLNETDGLYAHIESAQSIIDSGREPDNDTLALVSPEYLQTCRDIRAFFKGIASFDCHTGNLMKTSDGNHLIITDPVSFTDGISKEEFHVDPDELLREIEEARTAQLVARCKARKAKRDPNGDWRRMRKNILRDRRAFKRFQEKRRKEAVKDRDVLLQRMFNDVVKEAPEAEGHFMRQVKALNDGPVGLANAHAVDFAKLERLAEDAKRKMEAELKLGIQPTWWRVPSSKADGRGRVYF